jgi:tetratricopeptide (TPR) repeat protein
MTDQPVSEKSIFLAALEKRSRAERAAYLDRVCGDNPQLRGEVEALLAAHDRLGDLPAGPCATGPAGTVDEPATVANPGTVIGPYKLLQQIGEGGMGTVFMAEQTQPVQRKVALKVIKPGMDSRQVIARFEAERQALAMMDHVNIARVFDGGTTGGEPGGVSPGRPYFVMELVHGVPITKYCDDNQLTPRERLELFVPVCQAIQHAHQKGIIHRDIKPSNVMITLYDGKPVAKVIDFGVAKATEQRLTERTLFTQYGTMVGTLEYMSPEQAEISALGVDTRSDIYSLGVLLYELLTGSTPLTHKRLKEAAYAEILRIIKEEEPPRPSTRLSDSGEALASISAQRHMEPAKLTKLVRGELDWIVMKTLEKDRNRRYETASAFAADVQRYLADEPVAACPPSAWYRCRKFTRRNKTALRIAAAAALLLLLAVGGVSWALWDQAARRTELSERMAETEKTVSAALIQTDQWRKRAGEAPSATSQEADAALALWRQAEASLAQAETALRTGTADESLRRRVLDERQQIGQRRAHAQRTANLLRDLDDARLTRSIWIENHWDNAGASTKYAAAFAAYGLEVKPGRTAELARRIRAEQPAIREALIVALDDWEDTAWRLHTGLGLDTDELSKLVRTIAVAADDDPWRQKFRATAFAGDVTALRTLSGQARQLSLPPSSLDMLAQHLRQNGEREEALALLRWARGRHVTDFWILVDLGVLLHEGKDKSPVILEERIGCYRTAVALRPAAGAAHYGLGNSLYDRQQLDEAILSYSKAIELDPKYAFAWCGRGLVYSDLKQWDKALADDTRAIELNPKLALARHNRGLVYVNLKQWDKALADYTKAIELDSKFVAAWNNRGGVYFALQQWDNALADYSKAIELDPKDGKAWYNRGGVYFALQQWDKALADYTKAIELDPKNVNAWNNRGVAYENLRQWDKALPDYSKVIALDPMNVNGWNNRGAAYFNLKQWDKAIADYSRVIELDPKLAAAWNNRGAAYFNLKQWDKAIADYSKVIELAPKYVAAWNNRGDAYYRLGQWDKAIADYSKAIELDPKSALGWRGRGNAYRPLKQWDKAVADFTKAIDLDPKYVNAWCSRGLTYSALQQWDKAIADYTKVIELDPKNVLAWILRGSVYNKLEQWDKAVADFTKAIELDPKNAPRWNHRGSVYLQLGQTDNAIADFTKAIELSPKDGGTHNVAARVLASHPNPKVRDPGRAVNWAKKAVELAPKEGFYWNTLGVAHYRAGDWKAALAALEKSLELQKGGNSFDWFFLAMCHEKLGDKEKSRQWYDRAVEWMDKKQASNEELRRFRAEAAQVLGMDKKKD